MIPLEENVFMMEHQNHHFTGCSHLQSSKSGSICRFKRPIVAENADTKLFGTSCVATIIEYHLDQLIVIWELEIIE